MSPFCRVAFLALLFPLAQLGHSVYGQEKGKDVPVVLERFKVGRHCEALLVPVTFDGKTYQFLLDTGASFTAYDRSLPLGPARRKTKVDSAGGPVEIQFFDAPAAKIGTMKLHTAREVAGFDFAMIREVSGHAVYGVVGMDFLEKHIVEIDCDEGEVRFLKTVARKPGTRFRIESQDGCPHIDVSLQDFGKVRLVIDTGFIGYTSGCLGSKLLTGLEKKGTVRLVSHSLAETAAGTKTTRLVQGKKLSLGEFAIADPGIGKGPRNLLGMGFWSRFKVTFDFPNEVVYLQKGQRFATQDVWDLSGLHILRRKGQTIVDSVDKGSAAANGSIKAGDIITKVGERNADALSLFELRQLCRQPGATLNLVIEREGRLYATKVDLKK